MPNIYTLLYQAVQAPVLDQTQTPEAVSESKWHQPWSEPVRFKVLPALAVVLAVASGQSFNPLPIPPVDPGAVPATWFAPFRDPVRVPARLTTGNQLAFALVEFPPFSEDTLLSKWFAPLSEPVRVPARLATALNPFESLVKAFPWEEANTLPTYYRQLDTPVWSKLRLITGAQLFYTNIIQPLPVYPYAPNPRLTVRNQGKRQIPTGGNPWTSPHKYPPVNEA